MRSLLLAAPVLLPLLLCACNEGAQPAPPGVPEGPTWAVVADTSRLLAVATDARAEPVSCRFDWGDGDTSAWSTYVPSGTPVVMSHVWKLPGNLAVRAQARNSAEQCSDWSAAHAVRVLPLPGYPHLNVDTVVVGGTPNALACSPDGRYVYVVGSDSGGMKVISTADNTVIASITGVEGYSIAAHPAGDKVYIMGWGVVYVVRTADWAVVDTVGIAWETGDIVVSPSGDYLYVSGYNFWSYVAVVRTADDSVIDAIETDWAYGLAITPLGDKLYATGGDQVNAVYVIRIADRTVIKTIATGMTPLDITCAPDGKYAYVGNSDDYTVHGISTSDDHLAASFLIDDYVCALTVHPAGRYLYVASDGVYIIDLESSRIAEYVDGPGVDSPNSITALPDGSRVYVVQRNGMVAVLGF